MNSLNIDSCSKFSAFKKIKHLLYKHYHRFEKKYKNQSNSTCNRFLVVLYDCIPNMKHLWSIDKFVRKAKVLQVGTSKNPTTTLYSEMTKTEKSFEEKKTTKMQE